MDYIKEEAKKWEGRFEELVKEFCQCRNELCLKCGKYKNSHLGACDGCRYKN